MERLRLAEAVKLNRGLKNVLKNMTVRKAERPVEMFLRRETGMFTDRCLCPFKIADKKLNTIFMKDMEAYRKELSNARYDKRTTKKKHEPEYAYYSASDFKPDYCGLL